MDIDIQNLAVHFLSIFFVIDNLEWNSSNHSAEMKRTDATNTNIKSWNLIQVKSRIIFGKYSDKTSKFVLSES